MELKQNASCVALLGDVVSSRRTADRAALHGALVSALSAVEKSVPGRHPLRVTVGDEFQGVHDTVGAALDAALRIRLALLPAHDVRIGLGRGEVLVLDPATGLQDGSAWWAARAALEEVERLAARPALRGLRSAFASEHEADLAAGLPAAVNAALACQDHLMESWSDRSLRLLAGLLEGRTQTELASLEGISPSAVSQQVRSRGIGVILHAHDSLRRLP